MRTSFDELVSRKDVAIVGRDKTGRVILISSREEDNLAEFEKEVVEEYDIKNMVFGVGAETEIKELFENFRLKYIRVYTTRNIKSCKFEYRRRDYVK